MTSETTTAPKPHNSSIKRRAMKLFFVLLVVWFVLAYFLIPIIWKTYIHLRPSYDNIPEITFTSDGHPGDPLNVSLVGTEDEVKAIFKTAGWYPADPLGFRSDFRIAEDTVLERPYEHAPVSRLYLRGADGKLHKEDLAFEKPVGDDPKKRNHVRFWRTAEPNPDDGRPVWIGSGSFDIKIGLSHTTGQITHHISPDVDAERDLIFSDLEKTGDLVETYFVDGFHKILSGKNGGGDPWHTDGRLEVGIIKP
jgi:LssY C-terminus